MSLSVYILYALVFFSPSKGLALLPSPSPEGPTPWYLPHILLKSVFKLCEPLNQFSQSWPTSLRKKWNRLEIPHLFIFCVYVCIWLFKRLFPWSNTVYTIVSFESYGLFMLKCQSSTKRCKENLEKPWWTGRRVCS